MRKLLGLGLLALAAPSLANAANLAGTWRISSSIVIDGQVVATATPVCTFQQVGTALSGTCKGPNAIGPATGAVIGDTVSWTWANQSYTARGITGATRFDGAVINAHLIRGVVRSSAFPGASGRFTQTR